MTPTDTDSPDRPAQALVDFIGVVVSAFCDPQPSGVDQLDRLGTYDELARFMAQRIETQDYAL